MSVVRPPKSYDKWLTWVFDHPVGEGNPWHFDERNWPGNSRDWPYEEFGEVSLPEAGEILRYLTRLFEEAGRLPSAFSLGQIEEGLWCVATGGHRFMQLLGDPSFPLAERLACAAAMESVYRNLFALHCDSALSHNHAPGRDAPENPLNNICNMWWDLLPEANWIEYRQTPETLADPNAIEKLQKVVNPEKFAAWQPVQRTMLTVMERTLTIDHEACREGALHGLGHFHQHHPVEVERVVDAFLSAGPDISPELRRYAEFARGGHVM